MCVSDNVRRRSSFNDSSEAAELIRHLTKTGMIRCNSDSDIVQSEVNLPLAAALKTQRKHCVQHNYHDHSSDRDEGYEDSNKMPASNKGGVTMPFPMKLWGMLDHIENDEPELAEIVSWQPHGRCFLVHKPQDFAAHVLTRFFQQKKYASFQRQLNLYGFKRITKGPDRGSYYHELFLRGKQFLCRNIARLKIKGTGARMPSNPDAEPDFYSMKPITAKASEPSDNDLNNWTNTNAMYQNVGPAIPTQVPSTQPNVTSHESMMRKRYMDMHHVMPPLSSVTIKPEPTYQQEERPQLSFAHPQNYVADHNQDNALDFVFDNMPFHSVEESPRRNSLTMSTARSRRYSIVKDFSRRNSVDLQADGNSLDNEMDLILSLGDSYITEEEMIDVLEKIV